MDASHDTDARLGALLEEYQRLKDQDPAASVERMRDEAGDLYADLADLADCLDRVQVDASVGPSSAPRTEHASRARWIVPSVIAGLLLVAVGVAWFASRPGPSRLDVTVYPDAEVRVDGIPYAGGLLAPGPRRIVVERKGFARHEETLELDGEDRAHTIHLVPLHPFDSKYTRPLAKAYGVDVGKASASLQRPVGIELLVDVDEALRIRHPEAAEMVLRRFPEAIRTRDDIRFLAARRLFRASLFAESYAIARQIADRHPDRHQTWYHCARALAGLELVESDLYADVLRRFHAALPGK